MSFDWSKFWSRNFLLEHSFIIKDDAIITVSQLRMMQSFLGTMIQNIFVLRPLDRYRKIHLFKDPLNITYYMHMLSYPLFEKKIKNIRFILKLNSFIFNSIELCTVV